MILVGDIGGTNTTLAVVHHHEGQFDVVCSKRYSSSSLTGIQEALTDFSASFPQAASPQLCCLSGAGPIRGRQCHMTNVAWSIDGDAVEAALGCPTFVINDFTAICYALPLMDTHPGISTVALPHPDGTTPSPHGPVRAVVGAGTGLGTGFLTEDRGHFVAHPSEGGHSDFAPTDEEMAGLAAHLKKRFPIAPGAEQFVSGQGILNAYRFAVETGRIANDETIAEIQAVSDANKPGAIAAAADRHPGLAMVMRLFVRMYARYASNIALCFLPMGGLYLAGGIGSKNLHWFTDDDYFMRTFESNYNSTVFPLLRETPVSLITDYAVSLYGAAHAALSLE